MYLGEYRIDDYVTLVATTHRFSTGAAYAPSAITYRVYEDATNVEIVADTAMTNFDTETGFYLDRIQCTAALGYETGKTYTALIKATVDSVAAITAYTWRILTSPVNVTQVAGTAQTAGDLAAMITAVDDLVDTEVGAIKTDTAAILIDTAEIGVAGAGLTALPWNTTWDAEVQSEVNDALVVNRLDELIIADSDIDGASPPVDGSVFHELMSKTGVAFSYDQTTDSLQAIGDNVGVAGAGLTALGDARIANLDAAITTRATPAQVLTTALTEAYAADGAAPTLAQAIFALISALTEFSITGTTITCKKLDGTTTAMTFTLDDGTNPTSRTRAT